MKQYLIIGFLLLSFPVLGQLNENFSDNNFSEDPSWQGSNDGQDFIISEGRLRSNSLTPNTMFYLSTPNSLAMNCAWEFSVNLSFNTSGANYVDVYLTSDRSDLKSSSINGYFVRIGNTDDEISLYKRSGPGSSSTKIIDGMNGTTGSSNNSIRIRVSRDSTGLFTLERQTGAAGTFVQEGNVIDLSHQTSSYFGIAIQQSTATFFQKHYFDDLVIRPLITDNQPPELISVLVMDSTQISIRFNEAMDSLSVKDPRNYTFSDAGLQLQSVESTTDKSRYILKLTGSLYTGSFVLSIANVTDLNGNTIAPGTFTFSYVKPYQARFGDIIINEILPDPSPSVGLPAAEFAELRNNTNEPVSLRSWKFSDTGTTATLPELVLMPGSFIILCARADTAEFKSFGRVIGLSPWPSQKNSGDNLRLINADGIVIDSVSYADIWFRDTEKRQGGWSLERKAPLSKCEGPFNWGASNDPLGGTPGRENSLFLPDSRIPGIDSLAVVSDTAI